MAARGIHGYQDVKMRCKKMPNGCLRWNGCLTRDRPTAWIRGDYVKGARIAAVSLGRDHERGAGQRWFMRCGDALCLSKDCLTLGTVKESFACASQAGRLKRGAATIAKHKAARHQRPDVRPAWMVEWARESHQSSRAVAEIFGVHSATVRNWRRGRVRNNVILGPWTQLLAA